MKDSESATRSGERHHRDITGWYESEVASQQPIPEPI